MNLSVSSKTIHPDTSVDELSQFEEIVSLVSEPNIISQANIEMPAHLTQLYDKFTRAFDDDQKLRTKHLLNKYAAFILETDEDVGCTTNVRHKIETGAHAPVRKAPRRLPFHVHDEAEEQVSDMLSIEPSHIPWSSSIVLVKKKDRQGFVLITVTSIVLLQKTPTHHLVLKSLLTSYKDPICSVH